ISKFNALGNTMANEVLGGDVYAHLLRRLQYHYPIDGSHKKWVKPQIMILFASGDINKALEIIIKDLKHPIGSGQVVCFLVEECIRDEVIKKLREGLEPMDERIQKHPSYLRSVKIIDRLKCQTVHMEEFDEEDTKKRCGRRIKGSPIVVLDFPQYYFGDTPTAVITMSTFRTLSEAVALYKREKMDFDATSVWSGKLAQCFDLVTRIPEAGNWTFNSSSHNIRKPTKTNTVVFVEKNIHYEFHEIGGKMNTIAFPVVPVL
ncbi:hypothetical protein KR200_009201, partial [Drosophila serrata]